MFPTSAMNLRVIELPATDQPLERRRLPELPGRVVEVNAQHGEQRTFLEDGDTIILQGWCEKPGAARIGFGQCVGQVLPVFSPSTG